jgi:CRISPR-associated protein Csd2
MSNIVDRRYDFVFLFDCQDGNPNGDPDFDNTPRFDPETFQGLVSDVCLKRKIRDYIAAAKSDEAGYQIFVTSGVSLESQQNKSYTALEIKDKDNRDQIAKAKDWMCGNFFDVRAFGAVMSTKKFNCGQVRGPVQLTFARSLDRVFSTEHGITRVAYTTEEKRAGTTANTEMGRKHTVAYGLYLAHGFINPVFAKQTGFNDDDLALLWKALCNLFDLDRSAARGLMSARGLYVFEHSSALGESPAHKLFERVKIEKKPGVESPRSFEDYTVTVRDGDLPTGVKVSDLCAAYT